MERQESSTVAPAGTHTGQVHASVLEHWDVKKADKKKKVAHQIRRRPDEQDLEENRSQKSTVPEVK